MQAFGLDKIKEIDQSDIVFSQKTVIDNLRQVKVR